MAAIDYLLEIDGIKGESEDDKHKGAIHIESFSWGVTNSGSAASGGGGGAGKAVFQDMHFVTKVSIASPVLFTTCATGQHIKKAVLFVRKAGADQQEYYKVTMQDCLISSYQQGSPSGGEDSAPTDSFSMDFARLDLWYSPDGSERAAITAGYDLKANKKI